MADKHEIDPALLDEVVKAREQVYNQGYSEGFVDGVNRTIEAFKTGMFAGLETNKATGDPPELPAPEKAKNPPRVRKATKTRRTTGELDQIVLTFVSDESRPTTIHDFLAHNPDMLRPTAERIYQRLVGRGILRHNGDGTYTATVPGEEVIDQVIGSTTISPDD